MQAVEKRVYPHAMLRENYEQPEALTATIDTLHARRKIINADAFRGGARRAARQESGW